MLCTGEIKSRKTPKNAGKIIEIENVLCTYEIKSRKSPKNG